ncbi:MAG: histidine phosphatase family protein [Clostridiales bacterium]|nr:histidine phosphatase family protein [Clostridiales bacterium]
MKIYVIRHGETALNVKHVKQGWKDEPLNDFGRELAVLTGRSLRGLRFDACVTSPLARSRETVELVLKESGNGDVPVQTDDRLKEINFGVEENTPSTSSVLEPEVWKLFWMDGLNFPGFPEGESVRDVCRRTQEFLWQLAARDDGKTWLIGTHGCALRAMLNPLYEHPEHFWQGRVSPNCAITILEATGGRLRILESDRVYYDPSLVKDHYVSMPRI